MSLYAGAQPAANTTFNYSGGMSNWGAGTAPAAQPANKFADTGMSGSQLLQSQINSGQMNNPAPSIGGVTPWTNGNAAFATPNDPYAGTKYAGTGGPGAYQTPQGPFTQPNIAAENMRAEQNQMLQSNLGFGQQMPQMQQAPQLPQFQQQVQMPQAPQIQMPTAPTPVTSTGGDSANPYLGQQADAIRQQMTKSLKEDVLPGIGQGAQAAGMYGSSRHGIAEGKAMEGMTQNLGNSLANLYGSSYQADQANKTSMANAATSAAASNYNAQLGLAGSMYGNQTQMGIAGMNNATNQRGQDQSYALGQGNLGLGYQNSNQQFALGQGQLALGNKQADNQYNLGLGNQQLGYDTLDSNNKQFGAQFGLNSANSAANWANQSVNANNQIQNTPINYFNQFMGNTNQLAGNGGTVTSNLMGTGNPYLGAYAGYQLFGGK